MRKASLQRACEDIIKDVDGALACALVDIETGLPLAFKVGPGPLNVGAMELLSAAGVSYFTQGGASRGGETVVEIQTTTADAYHFMGRVPGQGNELLILVTDRHTTNLGLGWMSMRQALADVRDIDLYVEEAEAAPVPRSEEAAGGADQVFNMRSRQRRSIWD